MNMNDSNELWRTHSQTLGFIKILHTKYNDGYGTKNFITDRGIRVVNNILNNISYIVC